jgi:hypothetical protein
MRALTRRTALGALAAAPVACTSLGAAPPAGAGLGPTKRGVDLKADIGILRRAYTELHPGLYRYATPDLVAGRFDQLERNLDADQSLGQTYLTLSRFLATVRCGHSYANFFNQSDAVVAALFQRRSFLPFHFRWLGEQIVVERNLSEDASLTPGTVISHIDGIAAEQILAKLLPYVRADGSNDDKRRALLEVRGFDRIETFDVFHSMAFPATDAAFNLRVRTPGGAERNVSIAAHGPDERKASMRVHGEKDGPEWTLEMRGPVGVLTMPNWALYNSKWDWRGWLTDRLDRLAGDGARGLIVDVRGNEGGLDCGDPIIARLIDRDLNLDDVERRVRYRRTPADLDPYLDTWDKSFRDWGDGAVVISDGWYKLKAEVDDRPFIAAKGPRFTGKVVVLTDAQNSSATFQFAQKIKSYGLGQLVGQPTGGNQRGINGGAYFFLRMPGSSLEVDLPLIGYFPLTQKPDAGLMPDVRVNLTANDIATGRDRVMETALAAIG